jgi:phenylpropionate dioxygenase-like ring-hydroxylating dioxygenase large terminal subunit
VTDLETPEAGAAARHDRDLDTVFTRSWVAVGPLDRLAKPGDHIVARIAHVPVLLTRARDGAVHGFVNVCRHRAYPVATEDGCRQLLQCAYHAWTYDLTGRLNRAPRAEAEPGFDKADFSLVRVAVDTWGPLAWANPDPDAPPLRDVYPELDALATERGLDLAGLSFRSRSEAIVTQEWRRAVEEAKERHAGNGGRPLLVRPSTLIVAAGDTVIVESITPDRSGTSRQVTQVFGPGGIAADTAAP